MFFYVFFFLGLFHNFFPNDSFILFFKLKILNKIYGVFLEFFSHQIWKTIYIQILCLRVSAGSQKYRRMLDFSSLSYFLIAKFG